MNLAARRRLRDMELAKFKARALADPGTHPLRVCRLHAGYTTRELADATDLSYNTVGGIERRRSAGTRSTRRRLCRVLKVPVAEIFGRPV